LAELAEKYLKKGNQVYIEGKITTRSYEDKEGVQKYITEVVVRDMTFLGAKPSGGEGMSSGETSNSAGSSTTTSEPATSETEIDDLPF
jgi:single-strand DNA-binding protein